MTKSVVIKDGAHLREVARELPGEPAAGLPFFTVDTGWQKAARYKAAEGGDGVTVCVHRMPAQFYRIVSDKKDIDLETGSGQEDLVHAIAKAIAGGLLCATAAHSSAGH